MTMRPFLFGFSDELVKCSSRSDDKRHSWRRTLALGAGAAAAYGAYRHARKVRLSDNPLLRALQSRAKGRLTHIDALDANVHPARGVRKKLKELVRGVDEIIEETPAKWERRYRHIEYPVWHEGKTKLPPRAVERASGKRRPRIRGAVHAIGYPSQALGYKSDLRLGSNLTDILRLGGSKLEEAKYLARTGAVAKTESATAAVRSAIGSGKRKLNAAEKLDALQRTLAKKFPKGYVLKPVSGAASGGVPTHQQRWASLLRGGDPEHARWVRDVLKNPQKYVVQEYIPIAKERALFVKTPKSGGKARKIQLGRTVPYEYRVHVVGGKVVPGASLHRWAVGREVNPFRRREIREMEAFVQDTLNKLPRKSRGVPMAIDVAKLKNGGWKIIEANPGGESGFLIPDVTKTVSKAPHAVYKAVTGRSSKAEASAKALGAGGAASLGVSKALNRNEDNRINEDR